MKLHQPVIVSWLVPEIITYLSISSLVSGSLGLRLSLYSRWSSLVWPHPDTMGMGFCLLDFLVFFSGPSTWVAVGCGVFRLTLTIRRNRRAPGLWLYHRFFSRMSSDNVCLWVTIFVDSFCQSTLGFPGDPNGKEPSLPCRRCKRLKFNP